VVSGDWAAERLEAALQHPLVKHLQQQQAEQQHAGARRRLQQVRALLRPPHPAPSATTRRAWHGWRVLPRSTATFSRELAARPCRLLLPPRAQVALLTPEEAAPLLGVKAKASVIGLMRSAHGPTAIWPRATLVVLDSLLATLATLEAPERQLELQAIRCAWGQHLPGCCWACWLLAAGCWLLADSRMHLLGLLASAAQQLPSCPPPPRRGGGLSCPPPRGGD
jgi:hypothetical protein